MSGTGTKVCNGTAGTGIDAVSNLPKFLGTGIDVVPNLPKFPVPVLMRTEVSEVSGTGNTGGIYRRYASVRTLPNTPLTYGYWVLIYTVSYRPRTRYSYFLPLDQVYGGVLSRLVMRRRDRFQYRGESIS